MSKLTRKTAVVFGQSSTLDQIAEFGSLALGFPTFTTDPAVIQSGGNSTWLEGWFNAVIGSNSPAIEDMNAFCFVDSYQIAYLAQSGIAEYDSATTYYIGSLCQSGGTSYVSLANSNVGQALTNPTYWAQPVANGTLTPNTLPASTTVATGNTLTWPNATVPTGDTLTISTGANFLGFTNLKLAGTATMVLSGTATARII